MLEVISRNARRLHRLTEDILDVTRIDSKILKLNKEIVDIDDVINEVINDYRGKGVEPDIFPRLFLKFSTKSNHGTGLGLYICKSLVETHGGRIWAQNNKDGPGATFSFSLPIRIYQSG
jgi:signal transduction histidine kinase